jgi:hypothetical protein
MTAGRRTRLGTAFAAAALGAAVFVPAGSAVAGPPEDMVPMKCSAVKESSDPGAAGALALYGFEAETVKGQVGFFCVPVTDAADANFCAIANQKDAFLAIGKDGPCAPGDNGAPVPVSAPEPPQA